MTDNKREARKLKSISRGFCISHKDIKAAPGKIQCQICLDGMKDRYSKAIKAGMCTQHPAIPAEEGKRLCRDCRILGKVNRLKRLGLPEEECSKARIALQRFDGKCQSCGAKEPGGADWHTDHNDENKRFRGIICVGCNISIGHSDENPAKLRAAAEYLEERA